ncbi:Arm DNA-binding domain-containing protein [Sandaracinobacter neustonicus]|uniref:Arm DNA-binding domain-containing protein n=1 Tax=Sandaracinobacter neustonicus TaxID=1715348 RepID=UPI001F22ACA6|nr:Arm DNA-binding domain-containing protein [Sandaracinobacter neustonicus]
MKYWIPFTRSNRLSIDVCVCLGRLFKYKVFLGAVGRRRPSVLVPNQPLWGYDWGYPAARPIRYPHGWGYLGVYALERLGNILALTDVLIRNVKTGAEAKKLADGGGLFLLVTAAGANCGG